MSTLETGWHLSAIASPNFIFYHKKSFHTLTTSKTTGLGDYILFVFSVRLLSVLHSHSVILPRHNGQWSPTSKDPRSYPLHYFLILILEKEPVFPFSMLSAKQGNYWYHFYNVFGMMRSLTGDWTRDLPHSKPALYH